MYEQALFFVSSSAVTRKTARDEKWPRESKGKKEKLPTKQETFLGLSYHRTCGHLSCRAFFRVTLNRLRRT